MVLVPVLVLVLLLLVAEMGVVVVFQPSLLRLRPLLLLRLLRAASIIVVAVRIATLGRQ